LGIAPGEGGTCELMTGLRDKAGYDQPSSFDDPSVNLPKGARRSPYRSLFADQKDERGCLVLWVHQSATQGYHLSDIKNVKLTANGELKNINITQNENEDTFLWQFPKKDLSKEKVEFRLYVLRGGAALSDQQHIARCTQILKPGFQCFPNNLKTDNPCWFYLRIQPSAANKELFKLSEVQKGCQICAREICGNNIDEDCDGKADNGCEKDACHHPGATRSCQGGDNANVGLCKAGSQTCEKVEEKGQTLYRWSACKGAVKPAKETCNGLDDDCDGTIDEDAANCCIVGQTKACNAGGKAGTGICRAGVQRCYFNQKSKGGTFSQCLNSVEPKPKEECNGKDDDCDGSVDNGLATTDCTVPDAKGPCVKGKTQCKDGRSVCETVHPVGPEICDGIDNDCNGSVDEVVQNAGTTCPLPGKPGCNQGVITGCQNGKPICTPTRRPQAKELCGDGIDNDCNGQVDDDDAACDCKEGSTRSCFSGDAATKGKGACKEGTQTCLPSGSWGACKGEVIASTEVCDNKDNDCDGAVDESFPTQGQSCILELNKGPCRYGILTKCDKGKPLCKPNATAAARETCDNNIDDNCNGLIDDGCGCKPGASRDCYLGPPGSSSNAPCKKGQQRCIGGNFWSGCQPAALPLVETCNGIDDDCDGKADENNPGGGAACKINNARGLCADGKIVCVNGQLDCKTTYVATKDDRCDGKDNDCDGQVDEDDPLIGKTCTVPKTQGPCSEGKVLCKAGAYVCESQVKSVQETCNGIDDDCDGAVDNNLTRLCPNQKGVCAGATAICAGEKGWLACSSSNNRRQAGGQYELKETLCDGKDNDCDGEIDEDPNDSSKKLTRSCYDGPARTRREGNCTDGKQTCTSGKWSLCQGQVKPANEICGNQQDDNCDGQTDEGSTCGCWGDGRDGSLTVDGRFVLDKDVPKGRKQPALIQFAVSAISKTTLTLNKTEGLAVGDFLLLVSLQGNTATLGEYVSLRVEKINKNEVTVNQEIKTIFGSKDNADLTGVKLRAIRIPQFKEVVVKPGGSLLVSAWDGNEGGVLLMRVMESVRVAPGGFITVAGKGFRGGPALKGQGGKARPGESYLGWSGTDKPTTGAGSSGKTSQVAQSGGGGGHATNGDGGVGSDGVAVTTGGEVIPLSELNKRLLFGSGGGAGGNDGRDGGKSTANNTGFGGTGGGILWITARIVNNSGLITAGGGDGGSAVSDGGTLGGGGGGAGGTLVVLAERLAFYDQGKLVASGGAGGQSAQQLPGQPPAVAGKSKGGVGGDGRVEVQYGWLQGGKRSDDTKAINPWTLPSPPVSKALPAACVPAGN
jgi:hypothetical protein